MLEEDWPWQHGVLCRLIHAADQEGKLASIELPGLKASLKFLPSNSFCRVYIASVYGVMYNSSILAGRAGECGWSIDLIWSMGLCYLVCGAGSLVVAALITAALGATAAISLSTAKKQLSKPDDMALCSRFSCGTSHRARNLAAEQVVKINIINP